MIESSKDIYDFFTSSAIFELIIILCSKVDTLNSATSATYFSTPRIVFQSRENIINKLQDYYRNLETFKKYNIIFHYSNYTFCYAEKDRVPWGIEIQVSKKE